MRPRQFAVGLSLLVAATVTTIGQPDEFYPLALVQPGQRGYAKTVFKGTHVETFEVEILGVLRNTGPKRHIILARLEGEKIDRTGVFAGMSGSPVYLDGKLVGAIAYSFPFSKEPITGITPIEETLSLFEEAPPIRSHVSRSVNPLQMYRVMESPDRLPYFNFHPWPTDVSFEEGSSLGRLEPISTPLNLSGLSPHSLRLFAPRLRTLGLLPIQALGNAKVDHYRDQPLEAGSTITVQLVKGDMELNATGTVTHISGDKIYAFGHPFLSIGYTDLPLSKAAVLTVIPSLSTGQKLAAATEFVGSIKQDRAAGILGVRGETPKLIPVQLNLKTSRNRLKQFNYEIVTDSFLTPFLMALTVHNSIVSSERTVGGQTLQVGTTIAVKGQADVNFENTVSDRANSSVLATVAASSPVNFLLNSGFEDLVIENVEVKITAVEQTREAVLDKIWQDRLEVCSGEEVVLTIFLRKGNGKTQVEKYPVKIPEGIEPGPMKIVVGDGLSLGKLDADGAFGEFIPQNLPHLIEAMNSLKKNDRLYIRLYRDQPGAIIAGVGLPNIPPSLMALYNSQKTSGDVRPIKKVIYVEYELPATPFVLRGQREIRVNVK